MKETKTNYAGEKHSSIEEEKTSLSIRGKEFPLVNPFLFLPSPSMEEPHTFLPSPLKGEG